MGVELQDFGRKWREWDVLGQFCQNGIFSKICIRSQSELVQYFAGILEAMVANAVEI